MYTVVKVKMDPQEYVESFGGKGGGWFYHREIDGFDSHLLPLVFLEPDQDFGEVADQFDETFEPQIARGTHPNDHHGLVDVLRSYPDIDHIFNLEDSIELMREAALESDVFSYSDYEGQSYDGKLRIMIQPQNPGLRGSIIEHPHERETYLIDIVDPRNNNATAQIIVLDEKIEFTRKSRSVVPGNEIIHAIVDFYKKVRDAGFIEDEYSFQLEFGINEGYFSDKELVLYYQSRPFKLFQEPEFELYEGQPYYCFGMTPEDGIELPVVRTLHDEGVNDIDHPFIWYPDLVFPTMSLKCQPKNMTVFLSGGGVTEWVGGQQHPLYRWQHKADVSIVEPYLRLFMSHIQTDDILRVTSNGVYYKVERV